MAFAKHEDYVAYHAAYRAKNRDRINARNKQYNWENRWMVLYGVTRAYLDLLFVKQDGKCAVCGDPMSMEPRTPNYRNVDHDHAKQKGDPGFVRGLLCRNCNQAEGFLKSDPGRVRALADYLERPIRRTL
jgi:5-methylcytosine-specific restriction endonuclease McrA